MKGLGSSDSEDDEDAGSGFEEVEDSDEDTGEFSGAFAGNDEVEPKQVVEEEEVEQFQGDSSVPSKQLCQCNFTGLENVNTAVIDSTDDLISGPKENNIMVNVGVFSNSNDGGTVERTLQIKGNGKKMFVTRRNGIKAAQKIVTFKSPSPSASKSTPTSKSGSDYINMDQNSNLAHREDNNTNLAQINSLSIIPLVSSPVECHSPLSNQNPPFCSLPPPSPSFDLQCL